MESLLFEAATRAALVGPRITTSDELEEIGPTQWVNTQVETDLNWTSTFAFLDQLSRLDTGFRVTSFGFDVQPDQRLPVEGEFRAPQGRIRKLV